MAFRAPCPLSFYFLKPAYGVQKRWPHFPRNSISFFFFFCPTDAIGLLPVHPLFALVLSVRPHICLYSKTHDVNMEKEPEASAGMDVLFTDQMSLASGLLQVFIEGDYVKGRIERFHFHSHAALLDFCEG